jgi:hypothetical protein
MAAMEFDLAERNSRLFSYACEINGCFFARERKKARFWEPGLFMADLSVAYLAVILCKIWRRNFGILRSHPSAKSAEGWGTPGVAGAGGRQRQKQPQGCWLTLKFQTYKGRPHRGRPLYCRQKPG